MDRGESMCKSSEAESNLTHSMNIEEVNLASAEWTGRTLIKLSINLN